MQVEILPCPEGHSGCTYREASEGPEVVWRSHSRSGPVAQPLSPPLSSTAWPNSSPFAGVQMLNTAATGDGFCVGYDAGWSLPLFLDVSRQQLYNHAYTGSATPLGVPSGVAWDEVTAMRGCVVRHGSNLFGVFRLANSPQWSVWRGTGGVPLTWAKVHDLTQGGTYGDGNATGFGQCLASDGTYLFCAEYGDPKTAGVPSPKVWRTTDGDTWTEVWTDSDVRHVHAVACDPDNPGHVYITTGDGDTTGRLVRSTDSGATWETLFQGAHWQSVQISFSDNLIWLAPDADGVSVIAVDRLTGDPYLASVNFHGNLGVPMDPGGGFYSKSFWGAWDAVTGRYYFAAVPSDTYGRRAGLFMLDHPGGAVHLLAVLPFSAKTGVVVFATEGSDRVLYCGNSRLRISADIMDPTTAP